MTTEQKQHYFLSAGQVTFVTKENPNQPTTVGLNALVIRNTDKKTLDLIGNANRALQQHLFNRVGEDASKIEVLDVVQVNIQYLGEFTKEEFNDVEIQNHE